MAREVKIPKLGHSMVEGHLAEWLVSDGDRINPGDPIYRIETEKVENEVEAAIGGVIRILAEAEQDYPVGHVIAAIET